MKSPKEGAYYFAGGRALAQGESPGLPRLAVLDYLAKAAAHVILEILGCVGLLKDTILVQWIPATLKPNTNLLIYLRTLSLF